MNAPISLISVVFFATPVFNDAQSDCVFTGPSSSKWIDRFDGLAVQCVYYEGDPVALDRMLHNGTLKETVYINEYDSEATPTGRRVNVAEIAPLAKKLTLNYHSDSGSRYATPTMAIRQGTLVNWTNLQWFSVVSDVEADSEVIVDVAADEFDGLSKLTRISLERLTASANTLRAIASVSDRLQYFSSVYSDPENEIVSLVKNMTNLKGVKLEIVVNLLASTILRNSASSLENVRLFDCGLTTIKREMFRGMGNLTYLRITDRNTCEVEDGAFDDLINVQELHLILNGIKRLPHGLFDKLKKLKNVHCHYRFDNLSRANFTHVEDFENFHLRMLQAK